VKILVVSQYFWPEVFRINAVVQSLVVAGDEVDVLTGKPNYPEGLVYDGYKARGCHTEQWAGAQVFRVPLFPRGARSAWQLALNYLSFIVSGTFLGPWMLRGRQYDVVLVYGLSPILLALPAIVLASIKRRRMVLWVQDLWPDSLQATGYVRRTWIIQLVRHVVRWIYHRSDLLLVQSRAFKAPISDLAPGKAIAYFPNSVDDRFYVPLSATESLPYVPALEEGFAVVFAGNVGAAQAVEVIVEAAALLMAWPEIRFIVFGKGSQWDWMFEQIARRGLSNLYLPGRFPESAMPGVMHKASALLVTLADEPIFSQTVPNKVQAYLAVGRPIIASLNGEGARIVQEAGAGLAVAAQDAQALADAVMQLYQMPLPHRVAMGENGRRYFKTHFDHSHLMEQLRAHLRRVAETKDAGK
jgi:glycosyltransferase involved in cell wall biosynthesis